MSTLAIVMMVFVMSVVTAFAGYFFFKVLTTPPKPEPDSYAGNDPR
jgi:hypothetical protein